MYGVEMTRRKIRECTFSMLYCGEFHKKEESGEQTDLFLDELEPAVTEQEREYVKNRVSRVLDVLDQLDPAIDTAAEGWSLKRMGKVEVAILRLALFEMKYDEEVPVSVAINEAIELAKKFGQDGSPAFINGVLAKLSKDC